MEGTWIWVMVHGLLVVGRVRAEASTGEWVCTQRALGMSGQERRTGLDGVDMPGLAQWSMSGWREERADVVVVEQLCSNVVTSVRAGSGPFLTLCPNVRWLVSGTDAPAGAAASTVAIAKQSTLSEAMSVLSQGNVSDGETDFCKF